MTQQSFRGEDFSRHFRNSLGMFATGITVVTTRTPAGEPIGLTVNSFNSVSLDPPLIVWSLANDLPSRGLFEACEYYAINVLAEDQVDLSQRFASRLEDKFVGLEYDTGVGGAPLLKGCCARFQCRNSVRHEGGDHVVFISEVVDFDRLQLAMPELMALLETDSAGLSVSFPFFIRKTAPVSGQKSLLEYEGGWLARCEGGAGGGVLPGGEAPVLP